MDTHMHVREYLLSSVHMGDVTYYCTVPTILPFSLGRCSSPLLEALSNECSSFLLGQPGYSGWSRNF